ncbi:Scr1 family TA system antitoxin-like transcriptional regulator [Streptomyces sp. NPDC127084]|uniref:helix-turn-helix domain-containing protein n=1 Tax=Streptomyces sp. NPDC127084 TaxID=3347133 RepID=UPI003666F612
MGSGKEPSPARKHVGTLIKLFRTLAGMTQKELADRLVMSESLLGAYERAERIPTTEFLVEADRVLGAGGVLASCVEMMDEEKYSPKSLDWLRTTLEALSYSAYENMVIPGMLQTPAYARALYEVRVPAYEPEEMDRHVQGRLERQALLDRKPKPVLSYVIEESALQRPIGGRAVLREQLLHLLELVHIKSNLTVQVMPTEREAHAALLGAFQLMSLPEGKNLGHTSDYGGETLISKPEEVNRLIALFGTLRAQALNRWESVALIESMAAGSQAPPWSGSAQLQRQ